MKQIINKKSCLWLLFTLFLLLTAITQAVAVITVYEGEAHYFQAGALLPKISVISAFLSAAIGSLAAFRTNVSELAPTPFSKKNTVSPLFFGFLAVAMLLLVTRRAVEAPLGIVSILSAVSALPYTASIGLPSARKKANALVWWGFVVILSAIVLLAYFYFDHTVEMNAPLKVSTQVGLLMIPLLTTGELRYLIGCERPKLFMMLAAWTASAGALAAPSVLIAFFIDKASRLEYVAGGVLVFCAVLTSLSRIRNLNLTKESIAEESTPRTRTDSEKEEDTL